MNLYIQDVDSFVNFCKTEKMRILFFLFAAFSLQVYGQTSVEGLVIDSKYGTPLPYCPVVVKKSSKGTLTNAEGRFRIAVQPSDTLVLSYIGYQRKQLPVSGLDQPLIIPLLESALQLREVVVRAGDDYLFELLEKCRNKMLATKVEKSKVYFELETSVNNTPTELLEGYYNGHFKNARLSSMLLKNGRIALAQTPHHGYFLSLSTTKALTMLNLCVENGDFPATPLQFNKNKLKKTYSLEHKESTSETVHIAFTPLKEQKGFFRGEIWIDRKTLTPLKLVMSCEESSKYPFRPIYSEDSVRQVSISLDLNFRTREDGSFLLNHVLLEYDYLFVINLSYRDSVARLIQPREKNEPARLNLQLNVSTSSIIYCYDYGKPFLLPFISQAGDDYSDYRKIMSFPYNEGFWGGGSQFVPTEKQKKILSFFRDNGVLVNFKDKLGPGFQRNNIGDEQLEINNIHWSETKRIRLTDPELGKLTARDSAKRFVQSTLRSDLYRLETCLFLDVNPIADSLTFFSGTVLDIHRSYFRLQPDSLTECFLNLCFDLGEIARRKMDKKLREKKLTASEAEEIYKYSCAEMEREVSRFCREVQLGRNQKQLIRWNSYVKENLNIDNMEIFGLKEKAKPFVKE
jgi:hypothetical protein